MAGYSIQPIFRGEQVRYTDEEVSLTVERTWGRGERIFTDSFAADASGKPIPFETRARILRNLYEFFQRGPKPIIFVVWETDPHRAELEALLESLRDAGEAVAIEFDSPKRRQAAEDRRNLSALRSGWKVTTGGRKFTTVDEYKAWMKRRPQEESREP